MMSSSLRLVLALLLSLGMLSPAYASAAVVRVSSEGEQAGIGKQVVISVMLRTEAAPLNAVEGVLAIPEGMQVDAVETAGSAFSLWITPPQYSRSDGTIAFAGGVPGGIAPDTEVLLFTVRAHADQSGTYAFTPRSLAAYRNDGAGTLEAVTGTSVAVAVDRTADAQILPSQTANIPLGADIGSDPSLFEGRYFLSFYGGDNGSGVVRYAVKEGWWGGYTQVDRYYVLKDQSRTRGITVRAYRADDTSVALTLPAERLSLWNIIALSILALFVLAFAWKKMRRRS